MRTKFSPGIAAIVIAPPGADNFPVLIATLPSKLKLCPSLTAKLPALTITPVCEPKLKELGVPTNVE